MRLNEYCTFQLLSGVKEGERCGAGIHNTMSIGMLGWMGMEFDRHV